MQDSRDNIFLIGPMGSGKTTIGKRVARRLGMQFVDCDLALEEQTGAPISLIFDIEGEAGFRRREKNMLESLAASRNALVATGGGIVLDPDNRRLMRASGLVVYLRTSVDQQLRRLSRDRQRPLLQAPDRRQRLEALARERNPVYQAAAHLVVDSADRSPRYMARVLLRRLHTAASSPQVLPIESR